MQLHTAGRVLGRTLHRVLGRTLGRALLIYAEIPPVYRVRG